MPMEGKRWRALRDSNPCFRRERDGRTGKGANGRTWTVKKINNCGYI